jgi:WD40 repeat protein
MPGISERPGAEAHQQAEATKANERKPTTDRHGDPLPDRAIARLGTLRFRHGDSIASVAFTTDGKQILSHSFGSIVLWDATTGKELRRLQAEKGSWFDHGTFTADGRSFVILEHPEVQHFIRIRDCANLKVTREIAVGELHEPSYSPDGKLLAAIDSTFTAIELWDISAGKQVRSWKAHQGPGKQRSVWHVAFAADSKTIASGGTDRAIRLWDVATGNLIREIKDSSNDIFRVALSPDGRLMASLGMTMGKPAGHSPWDDHIRLWEIASGKELRQLRMNAKSDSSGFAPAFAFGPDAKTLAAQGLDGVLRFYDPETGKEQRGIALDARAGANMLAFTPNGKTLAVPTNLVRLIDIETGKEKQPLTGHHYQISAISLTPDSRTVATAGGDGFIQLWDAATGRPRDRLAGHDGIVTAMRLSRDGHTLFTTGTDQSLRVWDLASGKERHRFDATKMPVVTDALMLTAVSPDGTTLALANPDKTIRLLDVTTGKERKRLPAQSRAPWEGAFSPDGRTLIVWYPDHTCGVWEVGAGRELRHFSFAVDAGTAARQPVARADNRAFFSYTAAVSPDGRLIAYGNCDVAYIVIHEVATGKLVRSIGDLPDQVVVGLAFNPDGRTLAWTGFQSAIHLVETATGLQRLSLDGHRGRVVSLAFAADGRKLISGSYDTTALVWDLTRGVGGKRESLQASELDDYWIDLLSDDAARAYLAIHRLAASPAEAVAHLRQYLQPAVAGDEKRIARLIADIDNEEFAVRDRATKELDKLGEATAEACRKALEGQPSPEARRRLEALLRQQADKNWEFSADKLRTSRALEVLELAATPEAQQLITKLAKGLPDAWQTREAQAALERLQRRQPAP